jgi:CMP-N-acetylneuraminic acid synthetase
VPGKNLRLLGGKPLIVHTIEQALAHPDCDQVFVSTDDEEIGRTALAAGALVPFLRPAELATAEAAKLPVIEHLVKHAESSGPAVTRIVDLQPTSPLRNLADISATMALLDDGTDCATTAAHAEDNPYFNLVEADGDGFIRLSKGMAGTIVTRQSAPPVYALNGAVYVWHSSTLSKGVLGGRTRLHIMPRERSIDIDTMLDFRIAELLMDQNQ